MLKKRIFIISIFSILTIFVVLCNVRITKKNIIKNNKGIKLNNIRIPIYPDHKSLIDFDSSFKNTIAVLYFTYLNYPSKKIFKFYDNELKRLGFESNKPLSYQHKIEDWNIGYGISKDGIKKIMHAQFESFWLNKNKKQIAELILFFEWKIDETAPLTGVNKTDIQNVLFKTTFFEKDIDFKNLDIYEFYKNSILKNYKYHHSPKIFLRKHNKANIISIPIYPIAENLIEENSKNKLTREVKYIVRHDFLSKDVYIFYDKVLKKHGYIENIPKSYPSKTKDWISGYKNEEEVGKKIFFNHLDSFWINEIRNQISMLTISSEFEVEKIENPILSKDILKQFVVYRTAILDKKYSLDKFDIYKFFLNH